MYSSVDRRIHCDKTETHDDPITLPRLPSRQKPSPIDVILHSLHRIASQMSIDTQCAGTLRVFALRQFPESVTAKKRIASLPKRAIPTDTHRPLFDYFCNTISFTLSTNDGIVKSAICTDGLSGIRNRGTRPCNTDKWCPTAITKLPPALSPIKVSHQSKQSHHKWPWSSLAK